MSETPRTDAARIEPVDLANEVVPANFARQLETELAAKDRELAEARADAASWREQNEARLQDVLRIGKELDEERDALARIHDTLKDDANSLVTIELADQLHKARAAIREAVEFTDIIEKWLDQNGHGPNAPAKYHSNCFACGLMKKGAELLAQLRSCLPAPDCAGAVGRGEASG